MNRPNKRKNPFGKCRSHAKVSANRRGGNVGLCPYKKSPYREVWLKAYREFQQVDWVGDL